MRTRLKKENARGASERSERGEKGRPCLSSSRPLSPSAAEEMEDSQQRKATPMRPLEGRGYPAGGEEEESVGNGA